MKKEQKLDDYLDRFERRLPKWLSIGFKFARRPSMIWVRIPIAIVLIVGGLVGFLPILGFWMVPLGMLLLAEDVPFLQRPLVRAIEWIETRWPWSKSAR